MNCKNTLHAFSETALRPVIPELREDISHQVKWLQQMCIPRWWGRTLRLYNFVIVSLVVGVFFGSQTMESSSDCEKCVICRLLKQGDIWPGNETYILPVNCVRYATIRTLESGSTILPSASSERFMHVLCFGSEDRIILKCFSFWSLLFYLCVYNYFCPPWHSLNVILPMILQR